MEKLYKAAEVSRLAGFTKPWMLGHLERESIFLRSDAVDHRHGRVKHYTFLDLLILRAINRMLLLGMRPARIKDVVSKLASTEGLHDNREAAEQLVKTLGVRLFVTKETAYLVTSENEVQSLIQAGQLAFAFMVDLNSALGQVVDLARAYEAKRFNNLKVDIPILEEMCEARGL